MKNIFSLLLIISILLSGCEQIDSQIQSPSEPEGVVMIPNQDDPTLSGQTPTEEVYQQHSLSAVALPIMTELTHSEESTFIYQSIHLYCQDQEVADRVIIDFLNRQDAHRKAAESTINNHYEVLYKPMRLDSGIISLYGESVLHQGGNHPVIECQSANYSLLTGEVLTLGSILKDNSSSEKLQDALLYVAETFADDKHLYSDYPNIIKDRFSKNLSFDEDWYFSESGLNFFFEPYEIAPYISGVVILEIPYDRLVSIIDEAYFPAEEDLSEGNLYADNVNDVKLSNFTQIAEVSINGYSDAVLLHCNGLIRDVRVHIESNEGNTKQQTVFAASTISSGDGVMIMYDLTEDMPILHINYRSGQDLISNRLYFSEDGAFVLA